MSPLANELKSLQEEIDKMWELVILQLKKARQSLISFDRDLAREVVLKEKRVNSYELAIDRDCENILALFCPVAIDLRFVLAILKINTNLERIGDIAEGIAKYVLSTDERFEHSLLEQTQLLKMYDECMIMLQESQTALDSEDTALARSIFKKDEFLDHININAIKIISNNIKENPSNVEQGLYAISIIRKLERVGDQIKNISEEIIFFIEAKVLKHQSTTKE
ncbi:MAG: phosphate signaling complex protein PhoU [Bacteroidota bacterium]